MESDVDDICCHIWRFVNIAVSALHQVNSCTFQARDRKGIYIGISGIQDYVETQTGEQEQFHSCSLGMNFGKKNL